MWQEQMVRTLRNIIIHHHIEISKSGNCPAERPYLVWSDRPEKGSETANTGRNSYRAGVYAQTVMRVCCSPDIEKESVKIFENDYHALQSAQIFLQIFCFRIF